MEVSSTPEAAPDSWRPTIGPDTPSGVSGANLLQIEDVKRLDVKPGDVLLVTVPAHATAEMTARVKNAFETNLPVRVIVKTVGIEVEVAGPERVR